MSGSLPLPIPDIFDMEQTPIEAYRQSLKAGATTTAAASQYLKNSRSSVGNHVTNNSGAKIEDASSWRLNVATVFDIHTPAYAVNANQATFQAKTLNSQIFHNQLSSINNFVRAQNLNVFESDCQYNYNTSEYMSAAPEMLNQAGKNYNYGDYIKLQAGQESRTRISNIDVDDKYGCLDMGAINKVLLKSANDAVFIESKKDFNAIAGGPVRIRSGERAALTSTYGTIVKAGTELVLSSGGRTVVSAQLDMAINCTANIHMDGAMIFVGMGGAMKSSVDLESLAFSADIGAQVLAGDFTAALKVPAEISKYSEAFSKGFVSQVIGGDVVNSAASTLLGSFSPGNIQQYLNLFDPEKATTSFFSGIIGDKLPAFGNLLKSVVPNIFSIGQTITSFSEATFSFDEYPTLKRSFTPYRTGPVPPDTTYADIDGSAYAAFNSLYRSQPPNIPVDNGDDLA